MDKVDTLTTEAYTTYTPSFNGPLSNLFWALVDGRISSLASEVPQERSCDDYTSCNTQLMLYVLSSYCAALQPMNPGVLCGRFPRFSTYSDLT